MFFKDTAALDTYSIKQSNFPVNVIWTLWWTVCAIFSISDEASKCSQIQLPNCKNKTGSTESKHSLFAEHYKSFIEHPNREIHLSLLFGTNKYCVSSIKKSELHGNPFLLTEMVKLNCREIHHLYRNRYYVARNLNHIRGITTFSTFTPGCWHDNSKNEIIGNVSFPNTTSSVILCLHKNFSVCRQKLLSMSSRRLQVSIPQFAFQ